ncbi:MAG TPA: nuclear transport factor 2 family protein [Niastella sp.]
MKTLLMIALLSCCLQGARAQNIIKMETLQKDSLAISQVLENDYFKAIYEGDVNTLSNTFVAGALLFGDVKGQPYAKTLDEYLDVVQHRQSPKDTGTPFKGDILNIKVVNSIAIAEVKVKMYTFHYHEFLSLHKINDKWVIVNKMLSDINQ